MTQKEEKERAKSKEFIYLAPKCDFQAFRPLPFSIDSIAPFGESPLR